MRPDAAAAVLQMCYVMGAAGHSYVVGFGHNPPRNPHHRNSALTYQESDDWNVFKHRKVNANAITGALVGGPNNKDKWEAVSYTHLRAHETVLDLVCRLLLEKKRLLTIV